MFCDSTLERRIQIDENGKNDTKKETDNLHRHEYDREGSVICRTEDLKRLKPIG